MTIAFALSLSSFLSIRMVLSAFKCHSPSALMCFYGNIDKNKGTKMWTLNRTKEDVSVLLFDYHINRMKLESFVIQRQKCNKCTYYWIRFVNFSWNMHFHWMESREWRMEDGKRYSQLQIRDERNRLVNIRSCSDRSNKT